MGEYTTGAWGDEARDYYLSVRLPTGAVGDKMLAARVTLVVGGEPAGQGLVKAEWTDDVAKSTRMNKRVAEAVGEGELAEAIQKGIDAHRAGDVENAITGFGEAVRMANESGNDEALERLSKLVDIDDPVTGRVRPKAKVETLDVMTLETRSTRTSRTPRPRGPEDADMTGPCPNGHRSETADYCSVCGTPLTAADPAAAAAAGTRGQG